MAKYQLIAGMHYQLESSKKGPGKLVRERELPNPDFDRFRPVGPDNLERIIKYEKCYSCLGVATYKDEKTGEKYKKVEPIEGFTEEDQFVESEVDLVAKFGPNKFRKVVQQYTPVSDGLDRMNIGQLKELAEEEEIQLPANANKELIIKTIRESQSVASV
jgi:hypothetical protein